MRPQSSEQPVPKCEPNAYRRTKRWLVPRLAGATFTHRLRRQTLAMCMIGSDGFRRIATDPAFSSVQSLDLVGNTVSPDEWALLFESPTLTQVNALSIHGDQLPVYARSSMALRVRELTVAGASDFERDMAPERQAWLELIDRAPPPRRLVIECHNPGREVFAAMRRQGWLKTVRELSLSGGSQYEVYSGRTAGARSLFRWGVLPCLARLRLHELCDSATRTALAGWNGLTHLESLELTDDYHGRLIPDQFDPEYPPERARMLNGVAVFSEADVEQFLALPRLERLSHLHLSFCAQYQSATSQFFARISPIRPSGWSDPTASPMSRT